MLLAALPLVLSACGDNRSDQPTNVLLISLDTTRADHLGAYGRADVETPHIDSVADAGVLFEQCTSPAPLTVPSHASLMTGTYPFVHGVRDNGNYRLPDESLTLAEVLSKNGYSTGAQVGVFVLNRSSGLAQGFDTFLDTSDPRAANGGDEVVPLSKRESNELRANAVADGAVEWLRENHDRPFFLFAHFFDPHSPYDPPEPYRSRYDRRGRDPRVSRYLAEIAYVDSQVGRILQELRRLDLESTTLVILTADHGEAFGEHFEIGHSYFVYDTTVKVPLIMRLPGRLPAGLRVRSQVRLIDVAPTILDLAGLPPLPHSQGVSLTPYLEGSKRDLALTAYFETLAPFLDYRYSPLRGLRSERWKYILAPREELYDLAADPGELDNVIATHAEQATQMRRHLRKLLARSSPIGRATAQGADAREAYRLESLGYITGSRSSPTPGELDGPRGADPKDRIGQMIQASTAMRAFHDRDFARAESLYRGLVATDPDNVLFVAKLADTLLVRGNLAAAIDAYRTVLRLDPDHVAAHQRLAELGYSGAT
jgi:arylsulfatase A-like enzyme